MFELCLYDKVWPSKRLPKSACVFVSIKITIKLTFKFSKFINGTLMRLRYDANML